jgi:hypothetical protein
MPVEMTFHFEDDEGWGGGGSGGYALDRPYIGIHGSSTSTGEALCGASAPRLSLSPIGSVVPAW